MLYREPLGFVDSGEPQNCPDLSDREEGDIAAISPTKAQGPPKDASSFGERAGDRSKMGDYDGSPNPQNLKGHGTKIKHLYLRNFRNFKEAEIHFAPGINTIWGDNAQGKTNLLEAIS